MENSNKKQKPEFNIITSILNKRGTAVAFLIRLPVITQLVLIRAFPHIVKNKWWNSTSIIDHIFKKLKQRIDPALYNEEWAYTGSIVLEILLGETFNNGKKDVDVLVSYKELFDVNQNIKIMIDGFKKRKHTPHCYANTLEKKDNTDISVDFIEYNKYNPMENVVNHFDLECCRLYVSKKKLYISKPVAIITKRFDVNAHLYIQHHFFPTSVVIEMMYDRLVKYRYRGFKLNIKHKYKNLNNAIKARSGNNINSKLYYTDLLTSWFKFRPKEGIY